MDAKTAVEILRREFKTTDKSLGLKPISIDGANKIADFIEQQEKEIVGLTDDNGQQHIEIMLLTRKKEQQEKYAELVRSVDGIRPEVLWFAQQMEDKLKKNDHKGGWSKCDIGYLMGRLYEELNELNVAVCEDAMDYKPKKYSLELIISEAEDVANFAMMIADVCGKRAELLVGGK